MKWTKLGRIFAPADHDLIGNCSEFAQSPQALVFDDFIRIYFSSREVNPETGKALSHVCFVDMSKDFKTLLRVNKKPVIELGGAGSFDEHGIFPVNVLNHGGRLLAFTTGWSRRMSVSVETGVGMAESFDGGETFQKFGSGPVLTSSLNEPFLVADAFVKHYEERYFMWYIYGTQWIDSPGVDQPERVYKIGGAWSHDAKEWRRQDRRLIEDILGETECQALPTVTYHAGRYHMFFCFRRALGFRDNSQRAYRIGYAFSDDLVTWTRDDDKAGINCSDDGWDSQMMCYPHVFSCDDSVYMLYNGNDFGKHGFGLARWEE